MSGDYFRLDSVIGWRAARLDHLTVSPIDGNLRLPLIAGGGTRTSVGGRPALACVRAMLTDKCGNLFLLDAGKGSIRRKLVQGGQLEVLPGIGEGRDKGGSHTRQLSSPRGLTIDSNGILIVADTGNDRLQLFDPLRWTLLDVWNGLSQPWGVATDARRVYVAESGSDCIAVFTRKGEWCVRWTHSKLIEPRHIAVDSQGSVAVAARGILLLFNRDGNASVLKDGENFTALMCDRLGRIHAGTRAGILYQFARNSDGVFEEMGSSFCGVAGRIEALAEWPVSETPDPVQLLLAVLRDGDRRSTFWRASSEGASSSLGEFISEPLDSRIDRCVWHRLVLKGNVPTGASAEIVTQCDDDATKLAVKNDFPVREGYRIVGPVTDPDYLVQSGPGRFLRFKLVLRSSGVRSAEFSAIHAEFPRRGYLRYLPSVYQDDAESRDFLERFLAIFQTSVDDENATIERIYRIFDPLTVPEKALSWLAQWLAFPLNPEWSVDYQRQQLAGAFAYYQIRGTKQGVEYAVRNFTQIAFARVVEHYQLRRIPDLCCGVSMENAVPLWSPRIYSRWQVGVHSTVGQLSLLDEPEPASEPFARDANKFSVFFPADPLAAAETALRVSRVVEAEKPAHTEAILCAVFPRFRVGVQSRVGVDARVGAVSFMVLSGTSQQRMSRLGYDTILNPSLDQDQIQRRGLAVPPAADVTTRLL